MLSSESSRVGAPKSRRLALALFICASSNRQHEEEEGGKEWGAKFDLLDKYGNYFSHCLLSLLAQSQHLSVYTR